MDSDLRLIVGVAAIVCIVFMRIFTKAKLKALAKANQAILAFQRTNPTKILYLRNFNRDGLTVREYRAENNKLEYVDTRFETELSLMAGRIGHFISIGIPDEEFGADRIFASEENWKEDVSTLMSKSSMIIFRPSLSDGVLWEFEEILINNYLNKTVICNHKLDDGKNNYIEFRDLMSSRLELPRNASTYMCIDVNGNVTKYSNFRSLPLYKHLSKLESDRLKALNLKFPIGNVLLWNKIIVGVFALLMFTISMYFLYRYYLSHNNEYLFQ